MTNPALVACGNKFCILASEHCQLSVTHFLPSSHLLLSPYSGYPRWNRYKHTNHVFLWVFFLHRNICTETHTFNTSEMFVSWPEGLDDHSSKQDEQSGEDKRQKRHHLTPEKQPKMCQWHNRRISLPEDRKKTSTNQLLCRISSMTSER